MFLELIKKYQTIIIHRHSRPDGDALGSQTGLKELITTNFPNKKVYAVGDVNNRFAFIGGVDSVEDDEYNDALAVILDSAEAPLVSDQRFLNAKETIKIDHHIKRGSFTTYEIVNTEYESCAGLVADIAYNLNLEVSKSAATALITGMITDSGRFRFSTTPTTLNIASKLLATGVDLSAIYNQLYTEELEIVKLRAYFTLNFQVTSNNVAYMKNDKEFVASSGVDFFTISRGMVNTMSGIKGIDIWVNFTEDASNNVVIAEIRSSKLNINKIATKYGGGGHMLASGATLKDFSEADLMLKDLDELVKENTNGN